MVLEFEKIYSFALFTGVKKRYATFIIYKDGKELKEPEFEVKGFESKRSDSPQIIRDFQKSIFIKILLSPNRKEIKIMVKEFKIKFFTFLTHIWFRVIWILFHSFSK